MGVGGLLGSATQYMTSTFVEVEAAVVYTQARYLVCTGAHRGST